MSLERHLPKSHWSPTSLQVSYEDGRGILRDILTTCTQQDFAVTGVQVERDGEAGRDRRGKQSGRSRAREAAYATAAVIEPGEEAPLASEGDGHGRSRAARQPFHRQAGGQAERNRRHIGGQSWRCGAHIRLIAGTASARQSGAARRLIPRLWPFRAPRRARASASGAIGFTFALPPLSQLESCPR